MRQRTIHNLKFSTRVFLGIFTPLLLLSLALGLFMITRIKTEALARLNEKGQITCKLLAHLSVLPILTFDYMSLENYLKDVLQDQEIIYGMIKDKKGNPLIKTKEKPALDTNNLHIYTARIMEGKNFMGTVEIGLSNSRYLTDLHRDLSFFSAIAIATFGLCLLLSYLIARATTRPINSLLDAMKRVKKGDFSVRQKVQSTDETGLLAKGFNEMLQEIEKRGKKLEEYHDNLELQVEQRTAELNQANVNLNHELGERKVVETALRNAKDFSETILNSMIDAISIINAHDYSIIGANREFLKKYNLTLAEAIGRKCYEITHNSSEPCRPPNHVCPLVSAIKRGEHIIAEHIHHHNGESEYAEVSASPILDEDGRVVQVVHISKNITDRKISEQKMIEAREAAETTSRLKSEFLANMSHEIRTPMNGIIGMTALALQTPLTPEQRDYLVTVQRSSGDLLNIINDILDFSKIEAGKLSLDVIEFNLRPTVEEVIDTLAPHAESKGLELICHVHQEVPSLIKGDPGRLRQILLNLGSNAIKFTHKGEVVFRVELENETESTARLRFSVIDTGIGIPKDKQHLIFEAFTQVDGSTTRLYGGTGLGLTISSRLIDLMQGEFGLTSEPNKGSTFWFSALFEKQQVGAVTSITDPECPDFHNMRILVADDNLASRATLTEMIESFGCRVEAVANSPEIYETLTIAAQQQDCYHLLLCDLLMPDLESYILSTIKNDPLLKKIKIIILTSLGRRGDVARLRQLGMDAYLVKPVKQSLLLDVINTLVCQTKDLKSGKNIHQVVTRHHITEQKLRTIHILLVEDHPVNQKMALTMLSKAGYAVDLAENGRIAVEKAVSTAYDLIFMDIQMPELDGYEATARIREQESDLDLKRNVIIAMTAHAMKGDRERCLDSGMDDYIAKPINPQKLLDLIKKWTREDE